ncbi:serine/threonine-protein kinase BRI1-like 1-like protein [Corchorus olitorius]|uniref:Serine/threonine-protein kinase BRI1-like 1-like protein n=1 Tax=Corchorus olitorius TaxID=93759 RepID=A0A1R3H6G9_9ROSI|nr:serine/threonine-protein kinase BRI1-like 1-like protein [Corchorus olitorius]
MQVQIRYSDVLDGGCRALLKEFVKINLSKSPLEHLLAASPETNIIFLKNMQILEMRGLVSRAYGMVARLVKMNYIVVHERQGSHDK